ncbi:hypothetical protein ACVGOW_16190 [Pseudonocardia saturnea]
MDQPPEHAGVTLLFTALAALTEEIGDTELHGAVLPHGVAMVRSAFPWARPVWAGGVDDHRRGPVGRPPAPLRITAPRR